MYKELDLQILKTLTHVSSLTLGELTAAVFRDVTGKENLFTLTFLPFAIKAMFRIAHLDVCGYISCVETNKWGTTPHYYYHITRSGRAHIKEACTLQNTAPLPTGATSRAAAPRPDSKPR